MTKIELDYKRLKDFEKLSNNLNTVAEYFRHGDILIREVNTILENIQEAIDSNLETSFTKQDFDDLLTMRNSVLFPIFQNASFAMEFEFYTTTTTTTTEYVEITTTTTTTEIV